MIYFERNIKGLKFNLTCTGFPEQYDVFQDGKQVGYVRLRWGTLACHYPDAELTSEIIFEKEHSEGDPIGNGYFCSDEVRDKYLEIIADAILERIKKEKRKMKAVMFTKEFAELVKMPRTILYMDESKPAKNGYTHLYIDKEGKDKLCSVMMDCLEEVKEEEGRTYSIYGADYTIRTIDDNDELIQYLETCSISLYDAASSISFPPFTINNDLIGQLINMRMTINKIMRDIKSGDLIIQEAIKMVEPHYYRLDYFFDRKNNDSFYMSSEKKLSDYVDDDAFLEDLMEDDLDPVILNSEHNYLSHVYKITEVTKKEYEEFTK